MYLLNKQQTQKISGGYQIKNPIQMFYYGTSAFIKMYDPTNLSVTLYGFSNQVDKLYFDYNILTSNTTSQYYSIEIDEPDFPSIEYMFDITFL